MSKPMRSACRSERLPLAAPLAQLLANTLAAHHGSKLGLPIRNVGQQTYSLGLVRRKIPQLLRSQIGTNSPFAALHTSVSFRGFICRMLGDVRTVDVDPERTPASAEGLARPPPLMGQDPPTGFLQVRCVPQFAAVLCDCCRRFQTSRQHPTTPATSSDTSSGMRRMNTAALPPASDQSTGMAKR
jgi:hypothetical protein